MTKPTMFIGSSTTSLRVAKALAEELEGCVEVTVWNEGIFDLNRGVLEDLLKKLDEFDFAILVLAPDDMTESKGDTKQSPRDNVLFECGLFMGSAKDPLRFCRRHSGSLQRASNRREHSGVGEESLPNDQRRDKEN
jgi:predicted nucleotide-binding protein